MAAGDLVEAARRMAGRAAATQAVAAEAMGAALGAEGSAAGVPALATRAAVGEKAAVRQEIISLAAIRCLKRVEVGEKIVELLLREAAAGGGHHVAAVEDGLADEAFVGRKAAGQKLLLEETFQAGTVLAGDGVRVVAGRAGLLINAAAARLLRVQAEFCIGF